jgi:hypothetical protein
LHNSNFFADFDQNTKEVPTKISKKNFFSLFHRNVKKQNKGKLFYYRSKLFLCVG